MHPSLRGSPIRGKSRSTRAHLYRVVPDYLPVVVRARFGRPYLRLIVHMHNAEALGVAMGPLEVVEQTPDEVATDVRALLDEMLNRYKRIERVGPSVRWNANQISVTAMRGYQSVPVRFIRD